MCFVTAELTREIAKNSFYTTICHNAFDVATKISLAANHGDCCVQVILSMPISEGDAIIQELEDKGYKVQNLDNPCTGNGYEIDWSK